MKEKGYWRVTTTHEVIDDPRIRRVLPVPTQGYVNLQSEESCVEVREETTGWFWWKKSKTIEDPFMHYSTLYYVAEGAFVSAEWVKTSLKQG